MYVIKNKILLLLLFLFIVFLGGSGHTEFDGNDENDTVVEIEVCDGFCYGEDIADNDAYEYKYGQDEEDEQEIQDEQDEQDEQYEEDEENEDELISEDAKKVFPHLFNITYIKETTQNYEHLRVTLKETPHKGIGIFANKPIKANRVLLYYQMKVFNRSYHKPVSKGMYFFSIINKYEDELSNELIGDLYEESNRKPRGRIPFWGYLSNEPSGNQTDNAEASYNIEENYRNRENLEPGDIIIYKIWSTRDIEPGEEITWCYGDSYKRSYKSNCVY